MTEPIDFYKDLNFYTLEEGILIRSILELTYRCNFSCVHCYCADSRQRRELSTEDWKRVIDELAEEGCYSLTLTGGEVMVRRDFWEIFEHARKKRFAVRVFTNGSRISEEDADRFKELKPTSVEISIYGASDETYESVTGQGKWYEQTLAGIERLVQRGIRVQAKLPVLRNNAADVDAITKWCEDRGVEVASSTTITMRDDGDWAPLTFRLPEEALGEFFDDHPEPAMARTTTYEDHVCATGKNTIVVTPYGDVYPCVQLKVSAGNVRRQPISEIWSESPFLREIRKVRMKDFEECLECEHVSYCRVCMGLSWYEHGQLTVPNSFDCRRSDVTKKKDMVIGRPTRPQHVGEPDAGSGEADRRRILGLPQAPARVGTRGGEEAPRATGTNVRMGEQLADAVARS